MRPWIRVTAIAFTLFAFAATAAPAAMAFALQPHEVKKHFERANRQAIGEMQRNRAPAGAANNRGGGEPSSPPSAAPTADPQAAADAAEARAVAALHKRRLAEMERQTRLHQLQLVIGGLGVLGLLAGAGVVYLKRTGRRKTGGATKRAAGKAAAGRRSPGRT